MACLSPRTSLLAERRCRETPKSGRRTKLTDAVSWNWISSSGGHSSDIDFEFTIFVFYDLDRSGGRRRVLVDCVRIVFVLQHKTSFFIGKGLDSGPKPLIIEPNSHGRLSSFPTPDLRRNICFAPQYSVSPLRTSCVRYNFLSFDSIFNIMLLGTFIGTRRKRSGKMVLARTRFVNSVASVLGCREMCNGEEGSHIMFRRG